MSNAHQTPTAAVVDTSAGLVQYATAGDGPPVLFVHGSPGGWDQGELMTRFLVAAGHRVVLPSRPGYLDTPLDDTNGTPDGTAALLAALMDSLGIERFGVMCWSGGGPSTYRLAGLHPERVQSIVACAAVSRPYEFAKGMAGIESSLMAGGLGHWLLHELAEHMPKTLVKSTLAEEGKLTKAETAALLDHVWNDLGARDFVLELSATISGRRTHGLKNDHARFPDLDLDLGAVAAPVLLVHGTADSDVPPEYSDHALAHLPEAQLVAVDKGTHLAVWTDPTAADVQSRIVTHLAD
jgi:pimeloyl-ACP methyl ester carboxylesterase